MIDYQSYIAKDLKKIFGLKVAFDRIDDFVEQDIVICQIDEAMEKFTVGKAVYRLTGSIGMKSQQVNRGAGFLRDKMAQAKNDDLQRFKFGSMTSNDNSQAIRHRFNLQQIDFVYRLELDYNKPNKGIEFLRIVWNFLMKGK